MTVIGPDGTMTDGLDTAIFVLGVEKGLELIKKYPDYETIIVDSTGKISYSNGLDGAELSAARTVSGELAPAVAVDRRDLARVLAGEEAPHLHRGAQLRRAHVALVEEILHRLDEHGRLVGVIVGGSPSSANSTVSTRVRRRGVDLADAQHVVQRLLPARSRGAAVQRPQRVRVVRRHIVANAL